MTCACGMWALMVISFVSSVLDSKPLCKALDVPWYKSILYSALLIVIVSIGLPLLCYVIALPFLCVGYLLGEFK